MKRDGHTDEQIRTMLAGARRVAVVGMSRSAAKAAGQIPRYLVGCEYGRGSRQPETLTISAAGGRTPALLRWRAK